MQNIKKYFMTLALLLTAVTGAWAQTAFGVKEITADMLPASWSTDESAVTADDLAKLGFMEVTEDAAKTWTGAPQKGNVRLIYTVCKSVNWVDGEGEYATDSYTRKIFYSCLNGQRIFITTELTEWPLTPDADKKVWTLAKMPANDIELQVEYFAESNLFLSKEALADKANIAVKNGETAVDFDADGKSTTTVTEGNTVTVTYTGSKKVIGVKAEKKAPAVTVTWNYDDITGTGKSFTKDGVTITAGNIDFSQKNFMNGGSFTTTLGNFTKIEVSGGNCTASGEGWSGDNTKTWTGNASSVSFSGKIHGNGEGTLKFVFTIEPTN